jgi:two-component system cell cycle sensor histidine kinase/response regulator CckA
MSTSYQPPDFQGHSSLFKRLVYLPIAFLTCTAVLFVTWPKLASDVLSSEYMPHLYCYLGSTPLAWTHAIADTLIGLAYLAISGTLAYLIYRGRSDLPFHGIFFAFALFIVACGSSHLVEAVTVWLPVYVLSATIKVVTALSSIATAAMLPFVVPDIVLLVQGARTSEARRLLLEATLIERDAAQEALKQSNAALEQRVLDRTAQINRAKEVLEAEVLERRRNEEMLRQSEERFSKAFCSNPLPMTISTETEGLYLDVNDSFLTLMGCDRGSVVGRTMVELGIWVNPQDRITMMNRLSEQGRVIGLPTQIRASRGVVLEATVSAEQIELLGQLCVLAVTQDTTEMKRLQAQSEQAQKMEAIGRLAGGVAHDFNNLLGVIMGYCDLSIGKLDPELASAKYFVQIKKAAEHGASLTRQLLAFSRQQVVSLRVLDLNAVVTDASKMLGRVVREDIILVYQTSVPLGSIRADPRQIDQVLLNLVVNARDAMPDGGKITIETASVELDGKYCLGREPVVPGEYVMLAVRDTGCGIDEPTLARIFEPFFTTKQPGKGTGLGLASVYGIVKQSGGHVWVYSEVGRGATFKLYFPRVQADVEVAGMLPINKGTMGGDETILLVEDETALRQVTASALQSAGYTVVEADSAAEAIQLVETHRGPIHLLLTDVIMPHMNGVELSKRLKASRPHLKVIFASGYGGDELARQVEVAPDAVLLEKPFSRDALLTVVRAVLHELENSAAMRKA